MPGKAFLHSVRPLASHRAADGELRGRIMALAEAAFGERVRDDPTLMTQLQFHPSGAQVVCAGPLALKRASCGGGCCRVIASPHTLSQRSLQQ